MRIERRKNQKWVNPWDKVYKYEGVPPDLKVPYGKFNLIMSTFAEKRVEKVLDVAMGTGRHAKVLLDNGFKVQGFDLSETALFLAEESLGEDKVNCEMIVANMFEIYPYPLNFFDGVIAIQAIYHGHRKDMQVALDEIARVLVPGGVFGFTLSMDHNRPMSKTKSGKLVVEELINNKTCSKVEGEEDTYIYNVGREKGIPHFYPSDNVLLEMLRQNFCKTNIIEDNVENYKLIICERNK